MRGGSLVEGVGTEGKDWRILSTFSSPSSAKDNFAAVTSSENFERRDWTPISQGAGEEDLAGLEERGHRRLIADKSEERKASVALFSEREENESGWGRVVRIVEVKDEEGVECKLHRKEKHQRVEWTGVTGRESEKDRKWRSEQCMGVTVTSSAELLEGFPRRIGHILNSEV
ncbi:hypothetical protein SRHO_G00213600 [Serrasalmus rhombeus]